MTEWRKIPGLSRYSVSEDGLIRRDVAIYRTPPGIVKASINDRGYWRVTLRCDDGTQVSRTSHSFVALAFLGPRPPGKMVCHNGGDKLNIHYSNLRYGTAKSNNADTQAHGKVPFGTLHPGAKLSEKDIPEIRRLLAAHSLTQAEIGKLFGVSQRAIWQVAAGKKWKHVTLGVEMKRGARGSKTRKLA